MNLLIGLLLAATTAVTTPAAPAEAPPPPAALEKMPVFLQADAQDAVGATYVARLREALQGSTTYRPVADPTTAQFIVGIVTMDPNEADAASAAGRSTVAAVTLQRENADGLNQFVYSWVLVAQRDKVGPLASELLSAIDKEIHDLNRVTVRFLDDAPAGTR